MAENANITIERARTGQIIVDVTGISDWTGLSAKLFAAEKYGDDPVLSLEGDIDSETNQITYTYEYTDTVDLALTRYYYEAVVYNADKSNVRTVTIGLLTVEPVIVSDPTI